MLSHANRELEEGWPEELRRTNPVRVGSLEHTPGKESTARQSDNARTAHHLAACARIPRNEQRPPV